MDNESGAGGATTQIYESLTSGGNYYQIGQSSGGASVDIPVKKGAYVRYFATLGQCNGTIWGKHYIFSGLVSISANDDASKTNGTALATDLKNKGFITSAMSGGSTSESKNTQITATSTIHAYVEKR